MDYWKELIDERMTPKCKQLFDEILQENGIQSEKTIKKTMFVNIPERATHLCPFLKFL